MSQTQQDESEFVKLLSHVGKQYLVYVSLLLQQGINELLPRNTSMRARKQAEKPKETDSPDSYIS